jgi:hypothetical protein
LEDGDYKAAIGLLYAVAYTIKMSKKGNHKIDGYFDFVVPPLEGFWWQDGIDGIDYAHKQDFHWISAIRLPDFVTEVDYKWSLNQTTNKKKQDFSKVEFLPIDEGLCVQCMHIGAYDDEPATLKMMHEFMEQQGYALDITSTRRHHEIYLSDARKVSPDRLKTVIRHPIKKKEGNCYGVNERISGFHHGAALRVRRDQLSCDDGRVYPVLSREGIRWYL